MKKLLLWLVLLILAVAVVIGALYVKGCPDSPWYEPQQTAFASEWAPVASYDVALSTAKAESREMLLIFHATWCSPCRRMRANTWSDPKAQKAISDLGLVVYFCDIDQERALAEKFLNPNGNKRWGVPAYVVVDKTEKVLLKGSGNKSTRELIRWLR